MSWLVPSARRLVSTNLRASVAHSHLRLFDKSSGSPESGESELPPPPTDCCMSGCANCVWVSYAEELARLYRDGGRAAEQVLQAVQDPSLRIFLSLELREKLKQQ